MRTDRRYLVAVFLIGLAAATIAWAVGLNEWQAWLTALLLAIGLCVLYTVRAILPRARPRVPSERHEHPHPASR